MRKSGVLLHISSLWGGFGCGSFGESAKEFIDMLDVGGFKVWQVLPFCQPDEFFSPYKSPSAFSFNPFFIDLPTLQKEGLLTQKELEGARERNGYIAEFDRFDERISLLKKASERFDFKKCEIFFESHPESEAFCRFNGSDYNFRRFTEYTAYTQWKEIKKYANSKGIEILGDLPIYVSLNSSDVKENPKLFLLDEKNIPLAVAGVPPDAFSSEGQVWGNPLYNWGKMKENDYKWWKRRIEYSLEIFDGIRLDHFRGFDAFFAIPFEEKTALNGRWMKGPQNDFVDKIKEVTKDKLVVGENLGHITESAEKLLEYSGFHDMRVLQFAFDEKNSKHLPHNYSKLSVAYTSTHDNNTLIGYIANLGEEKRRYFLDYFRYKGQNWYECYRDIITSMIASSADCVIFPIQDILGFGEDTRMNTPGKSDGNWRYRVTRSQAEKIDLEYYRKINSLYGRRS